MNPTKIDAVTAEFPACPVNGTALLTPITSWAEMYRETQTTGVEFSELWDDSVHEGAAYFFRWLGEPRATVLVIWENDHLTFVECRKAGDVVLSEAESAPIFAEIARAFAGANFARGRR